MACLLWDARASLQPSQKEDCQKMCLQALRSLVLFAALLCPCRVPDSAHLGPGRSWEGNTSHRKLPLVKPGEPDEPEKSLIYGRASEMVP